MKIKQRLYRVFLTESEVDKIEQMMDKEIPHKITTEIEIGCKCDICENPIERGFYLRMKKFADEDEKLHDFYRGKSPSQIFLICNGIYDRIHELVGRNVRSPQVNWEYRKLSVGIEILRDYGIWWTPSTDNTKEEMKDENP